jgi:hypothetical protein
MNCGELRKALKDTGKYPDDLPISICVVAPDELDNDTEIEELAGMIRCRTDWDGKPVIAVISDNQWEE